MKAENDHHLKNELTGRSIYRYLLVVVAVFVVASMVALAAAAYRARKQALAVERLQGAGLTAFYDYEVTGDGTPDAHTPAATRCWNWRNPPAIDAIQRAGIERVLLGDIADDIPRSVGFRHRGSPGRLCIKATKLSLYWKS